MPDLSVFLFEERNTLRLLDEDGEVWFVLKDVCKALSLTNPRQAAQRLDDDEKGVISTDTLGGRQSISVVSEAGLFSLILSSRKAEARRFKRWVTHEVLPTLRRTGRYETHQTELLEQVVPYLHDQQLRILHAVQAAASDFGLVQVGRLPMITGLSIQKVRRTLHLFENLRVIWWETPELVRLRRRYRPSTNRSSRTLMSTPESLSPEDAR